MILIQKRIYRQEVARNSWATYVFSDNDLREGLGGQAKAMRGFPNSLGIRTKKAPSMKPDAFYTDAEYDMNIAKIGADLDTLEARLDAGGLVVMPADGLGTGLAQLRSRAPKTFAYLNNRLYGLIQKYANPDNQVDSSIKLIDNNTHTVVPKAIEPATLEDMERLLASLIRVDGVIWSQRELRRMVRCLYSCFVGTKDWRQTYKRPHGAVTVAGDVDLEA